MKRALRAQRQVDWHRPGRLPHRGVGFDTFVRDDGTVYHTYSTTARGVEFLMSYYPILDCAPKGRDEGDAWQVWIRPHDEYDSQ